MNAADAPERTYHVIAALDFTDLSDRALEQSIALCSHHPRAKLHVITVGRSKDDSIQLPGSNTTTPHAADDLRSYVMEQIARYKGEHGPFSIAMVAVYVAVGKPAERILSLAKTVNADVIVMGTHGRQGVKRFLEGSVAEQVVREADCGVYVVHKQTRKPPERTIPPPPAEIEVIFDGEA